jgi:hypothetical protein
LPKQAHLDFETSIIISIIKTIFQVGKIYVTIFTT